MSIILHQLSVRLGEQQILDQFNLILPDQGIVGISGPSGSGKTTLLLTLCGLIKPDSGWIESDMDLRPSIVFQEDRLIPWLTVGENLNLILHNLEQTRLWLQRIQMADQENSYPHQLSGGMKRRVALARALAFESNLLLLDEPFQGMDTILKESLYPWIRKVGEEKPVVLVTHDEREQQSLANTIFYVDGPPLRLK